MRELDLCARLDLNSGPGTIPTPDMSPAPYSLSVRQLSVRVPASTSNLGPGFDLLGLAFSMFLEVELRGGSSGSHRLLLGEGAEAWPTGSDNKLLAAFEGCRRAAGESARDPFDFAVRSEIPLGRGFGSSAAAFVAGVLLANHLASRPLTGEELLALAIELEGHPDNVTPALLGGCTLTLPRAGAAPVVVRQPLHTTLAMVVAWPEQPLETALARRLLPASVPFADAVENPRRLALLLEGLRTGDPELLSLGQVDRLHERYRLPRIPGGAQALQAAREAGAWLATVSGSGSGLFAIGPRAAVAGIAEAFVTGFREGGAVAQARAVEPVAAAPAVRAAQGRA
jgi:homoserine kinase